MPDVPTSPPTPPVVPWGPGSTIGVSSGVLSLVAALVDAITSGVVDSDTRTLIISGVAALVLTSLGRMFQAGMAYLASHGIHVPTYEPPPIPPVSGADKPYSPSAWQGRPSGEGGYALLELLVGLVVLVIVVLLLLKLIAAI